MTSYTVTFNRRHVTSGHLFQGRFKALLVEDESYGSKVNRYIHLNPVRVKNLSTLEFEEKNPKPPKLSMEQLQMSDWSFEMSEMVRSPIDFKAVGKMPTRTTEELC